MSVTSLEGALADAEDRMTKLGAYARELEVQLHRFAINDHQHHTIDGTISHLRWKLGVTASDLGFADKRSNPQKDIT